MKPMELIEHLTWAIVEVSTVDGKPDLLRVAAALEAALVQALMAQEKEARLKQAVVRTAAVCGEPIDDKGGVK